MILFAAGAQVIQGMATDNDDEAINEAAVAFDQLPMALIVIIALIQVVCFGIGAYGAVQFTPSYVMVALVCHCFSVLGNLISLSLVGVVVSGFFIYPHVVFLKEMRNGIMTPDNYANEKHSCCCV